VRDVNELDFLINLVILFVITDIINMEDGKQGLAELQGTKTFTWELSVSSFSFDFTSCTT
jgi:hypothetical protein